MAGLCLVVLAEFLRPGTAQSILADGGIVALILAAILLVLQNRRPREAPEERGSAVNSAPRIQSKTAWRWSLVGLGLFGALVCQSWFKVGTAIAGGDTAPPIGTAWISDIFARYAWTGNLGAPGQSEGTLPWATLDLVVHALGGSGALAQRLWLSLLLAGVVLAAGALLRSLGVGALAGVVGAVFYLLNPFTLSNVGINDVWLAAMVLLPALGAVVIAYAKGSFTLWQSLLVLVIAAPFLGFAYANPPLVGVLAVAFVLSPLLVRLRFGRAEVARAWKVVVVGGLVIIAASAYWLIPAKIAVADVATGTLSSLSSWAFTESRSTIANGLWLNTSWAWRYTSYDPYAPQFVRFPLVLVRVLVPLAPFSILAVKKIHDRAMLETSGAFVLVALAVVILSTGTRFPGSLIFDPLYHLPYGWLLQVPGRFLMVSALCYGVLVAFLVEHLGTDYRARRTAKGEHIVEQAPRVARPVMLTSLGILALALASSYPIWTGSLISGPHDGFPSTHVKVPSYWTETARYMNRHGPSGSMLVLPPDDFYQMPYTWYYGNDGFITNLFKRHVIDPSGQGYDKVSKELLQATDLEASELVSHHFGEARRILGAIGTPMVMVRGDVEATFPGNHNIVSPLALKSSLQVDPEMRLVYRNGPLSIYEVTRPLEQPTNFATTDSASPNLLELSLLPQGAALVTSPPVPGHTAVTQLPPIASWKLRGNVLTTSVPEHVGWIYSPVLVRPSGPESGRAVGLAATTIDPHGPHTKLQVSLPVGSSLIDDPNFEHGLWQEHVGNCVDAVPAASGALSASFLAHGGPSGQAALALSASMDRACEATTLDWTQGPVLLKMFTRSSSPEAPTICLWEEPEATCASLPAVAPSISWRAYSATVNPTPGTTQLTLFLYASPLTSGQHATEFYSGIVARSLPQSPTVEVVARPIHPRAAPQLVTTPEGYSPGWRAAGAGLHVEVDGLRNGWFTTRATATVVHTAFAPVAPEFTDEWALAAGALVTAILAGVLWSANLRRRARSAMVHQRRDNRRVDGRRQP